MPPSIIVLTRPPCSFFFGIYIYSDSGAHQARDAREKIAIDITAAFRHAARTLAFAHQPALCARRHARHAIVAFACHFSIVAAYFPSPFDSLLGKLRHEECRRAMPLPIWHSRFYDARHYRREERPSISRHRLSMPRHQAYLGPRARLICMTFSQARRHAAATIFSSRVFRRRHTHSLLTRAFTWA